MPSCLESADRYSSGVIDPEVTLTELSVISSSRPWASEQDYTSYPAYRDSSTPPMIGSKELMPYDYEAVLLYTLKGRAITSTRKDIELVREGQRLVA